MKKVFLVLFIQFAIFPSFAHESLKKTPLPISNLKAIQISLSPGMSHYLDLNLAVDLTTRPMTVKGKYQSFNDKGDLQRNCNFSGRLTRTEAQTLRRKIQALRYCSGQGNEDMIIDPEYLETLKAYTQRTSSGSLSRGSEIRKNYLVGWGPQKYLCQGAQDFYRFMKHVSEKRAPHHCPSQSSKLFHYSPNL